MYPPLKISTLQIIYHTHLDTTFSRGAPPPWVPLHKTLTTSLEQHNTQSVIDFKTEREFYIYMV